MFRTRITINKVYVLRFLDKTHMFLCLERNRNSASSYNCKYLLSVFAKTAYIIYRFFRLWIPILTTFHWLTFIETNETIKLCKNIDIYRIEVRKLELWRSEGKRNSKSAAAGGQLFWHFLVRGGSEMTWYSMLLNRICRKKFT